MLEHKVGLKPCGAKQVLLDLLACHGKRKFRWQDLRESVGMTLGVTLERAENARDIYLGLYLGAAGLRLERELVRGDTYKYKLYWVSGTRSDDDE